MRLLPPAALGLVVLAGVTALSAGGAPDARDLAGAYSVRARPNGTVRAFDVTAAPADVTFPDGRRLHVWAYNGTVPGPTLRVRLGDTVRVRFTNHLPQPTTIHWHGVRVPNAMDGVPGVTQPAIQPGETFTYEFTPKDAGTFWFHPHLRSSEQIERGLFGVLVVEDAAPRPYSREVVWVLDDWLLGRDGEIFPQFNTRHDLMHDGRWGNVITVNGSTSERLDVAPGERVRLRLVNVANGRVFQLGLGGLDARVIAVDGLYTARPLDPGAFEIAPGNRLDLDVTIPPDAAGRRYTVVNRFRSPDTPLVSVAVAGPRVTTPRFAPPAAAVPAWADRAAVAPRLTLRLNARAGGPFGIAWTINDVAFDHDAAMGAMDHGAAEHDGMTAADRLPLGTWSRLRFVNESYRLHPMHIHGLFFKLLARNGVPVDEPFFRDTVLVHAQETVDVGTVPLDPGRWMVHCHILEHAESGMMTLVDVR
ncbi:MAG TPA: multicopper oxidase family protein [Candidatus Binatia bacterium]|jgi:FtsP/CotA-like multicopper oxidase with cupredoxin domain